MDIERATIVAMMGAKIDLDLTHPRRELVRIPNGPRPRTVSPPGNLPGEFADRGPSRNALTSLPRAHGAQCGSGGRTITNAPAKAGVGDALFGVALIGAGAAMSRARRTWRGGENRHRRQVGSALISSKQRWASGADERRNASRNWFGINRRWK